MRKVWEIVPIEKFFEVSPELRMRESEKIEVCLLQARHQAM